MKSCFKIDKNYNWKCWSFEVFFKWLQSLNEHKQNPQTTCYFIFIQCKIRKLLKIRKEYQSTGFIFDYCNYRSEQKKWQSVNQCKQMRKQTRSILFILSSNNGGKRQSVIERNENKEESRVCLPCTWCYMQGRLTHGLYRQHHRKYWICIVSLHLFHT